MLEALPSELVEHILRYVDVTTRARFAVAIGTDSRYLAFAAKLKHDVVLKVKVPEVLSHDNEGIAVADSFAFKGFKLLLTCVRNTMYYLQDKAFADKVTHLTLRYVKRLPHISGLQNLHIDFAHVNLRPDFSGYECLQLLHISYDRPASHPNVVIPLLVRSLYCRQLQGALEWDFDVPPRKVILVNSEFEGFYLVVVRFWHYVEDYEVFGLFTPEIPPPNDQPLALRCFYYPLVPPGFKLHQTPHLKWLGFDCLSDECVQWLSHKQRRMAAVVERRDYEVCDVYLEFAHGILPETFHIVNAVDWEHLQLGNPAMLARLHHLVSNQTVGFTSLRRLKLSDQLLAGVRLSLPHLKRLDCSRFPHDEPIEVALNCPKLTDLELSWVPCKSFELNCPVLRTVKLADCSGFHLSDLPQLVCFLSLYNCRLEPPGGSFKGERLVISTSHCLPPIKVDVTHLELSLNRFVSGLSSRDVFQNFDIVQALVVELAGLNPPIKLPSSVKVVSIEGATLSGRLFSGLPNLVQICLHSVFLEDDIFMPPNIERLVWENGIIAKKIRWSLVEHLQDVRITGCHRNSEPPYLPFLFELPRDAQKLVYLYLDRPPLLGIADYDEAVRNGEDVVFEDRLRSLKPRALRMVWIRGRPYTLDEASSSV